MKYLLLQIGLSSGAAPLGTWFRALMNALGSDESDIRSQMVIPDESTWRSVSSEHSEVFQHLVGEGADEVVLVDLPRETVVEEDDVSSLGSPALSVVPGAVGVDARILDTVRDLEESDVDEWQFSPDLSDDAPQGPLTQDTPFGKFVISRALAHTETSAVFTVFPRRDLVIKYQMDCFEAEVAVDGGRIHPLIHEYHFLGLIQELGIAPRIYYLSAPTNLPPPPGGRMRLTIDPAEYMSCHEQPSKVRYVVMDRMGTSLHDHMRTYPHGRVPFFQAVELGIEMINVLQLLHEEGGIQHNDCHYGNFVIHRGTRVKLIDFGRASYIREIPADDEMNPNAYEDNNPLLTPWEMEGFRASRRDDVYRAIFAVAGMMNGHEFIQTFRRFNHMGPETFAVKAFENFMVGANGATLFRKVTVPEPDRITGLLRDIVTTVRSTGINERPQYETIRALFHQILDTRISL